jgi:hypothetical protein
MLMVDIVLPVIYEESSSMWQSSSDGWVTTALLDAGVGLRDVWETVAGLYERVSTTSTSWIVKGLNLMNRARKTEDSWRRKLVSSFPAGSRKRPLSPLQRYVLLPLSYPGNSGLMRTRSSVSLRITCCE